MAFFVLKVPLNTNQPTNHFLIWIVDRTQFLLENQWTDVKFLDGLVFKTESKKFFCFPRIVHCIIEWGLLCGHHLLTFSVCIITIASLS